MRDNETSILKELETIISDLGYISNTQLHTIINGFNNIPLIAYK